MIAQRWISGFGFILVAGLLGLLGWGLLRPGSGSNGPGVNSQGSLARTQPRAAPALRLRLFDAASTPWQLADQRGKRVILNFWASWCPPCRTEAPVLAQAARDYQARGIELVGVNVWDQPEAARQFLDEFGIDYPNGRDEAGAAAVDYGVTGIPETFIVDEQGQVVRHWIGPLTRSALDTLVADVKQAP